MEVELFPRRIFGAFLANDDGYRVLTLGFSVVVVFPYDLLNTYTPVQMIGLVKIVCKIIEKIPLLCETADSVIAVRK